MKPKAIVVLGDSYSNGDGVSWDTQAPRIMGEEWFAESESLLHKIAWYRINKPSHPLTDMMEQQQTRFMTDWHDHMARSNWNHKEYTEVNGNWSSVLSEQSGWPVVNIALPGGSTQSMTESLLIWVDKNPVFIAEHDICVMANFSKVDRTSITARREDHDYTRKQVSDIYANNTIHYSPGCDDRMDPYLVHLADIGACEWEFCSNLLLIKTICDNASMSMVWCGPIDEVSINHANKGNRLSYIDGIKDSNFLGLSLPIDRNLTNICSELCNISLYTMWVNSNNIKDNGFNPYSLCGHFNAPAQKTMGTQLNQLIQGNKDWFFNYKCLIN